VATSISGRLGIPLPEGVCRRLEEGGAEEGWRHFAGLLSALAATFWADGVAIMTYAADPPDEVGRRIAAAVAALPRPPSGSRVPPGRSVERAGTDAMAARDGDGGHADQRPP
jgi:hypothetical protein